MSESKRPKLTDLAAATGLSEITVWRALNRPDSVAEKTRRKVELKLEEIGYVRDMVASSLSSKRTGIVAAIVPTLANSIFADMIDGLSSELDLAGFRLLLANSGYDINRELTLMRAFAGRRPEGVVLTGGRHHAAAEALLRNLGIPVVETWCLRRDRIDMAVGFSNRLAGHAATRFLIERGRKHYAFLSGPMTDNDRANDRMSGFRHALRAAKIEFDPRLAAHGPISLNAGALAIDRLLAIDPDFDALVCTGDVLAIGAMSRLQDLGKEVPRDVAVIGMGDLDIAAFARPGLTTLRIPAAEIGRKAGRALVERMAGHSGPKGAIDVGFEIVARGST
jgi:LacI family gluconate utilization system Gnt-I transcriptional repressor